MPGLFGVSHGAIQFVTYEELKKHYHNYYNQPITTKQEFVIFGVYKKNLLCTAFSSPEILTYFWGENCQKLKALQTKEIIFVCRLT